MKKNEDTNLTKDELIRLLKNQDIELRVHEEEERERQLYAQEVEAEILRKQRDMEKVIRIENEINEQKNINLIQKYNSEATIKKSEIKKSQEELEAIDQELLQLLNNSKKRIAKLAHQFIDLKKEKTVLLAENQITSRNDLSSDIKSVSKYYENSLIRNKRLLNEEVAKERETHKNMEVLTQAIDVTLLKKRNEKALGGKPSPLIKSNKNK